MKQKTIWKFILPSLTDHITILMPKGAEVLTFQMQDDEPVIWALVYPDATTVKRHFRLAGTGHPMPTVGKSDYIGTVQVDERGALVLHLFEETLSKA